MKVLSTPHVVRWLGVALLTCALPAAWQAVLMSSRPWWQISAVLPLSAALIALLLISPGVYGLFRAKRWTLRYLEAIAAFWVLLTGWVALRQHSTLLGFFALALAAAWTALLSWSRAEMGRSFWDPQMRWFQGLPEPIPGLECQFQMGEKKESWRVARLDEDGAFVFRDDSAAIRVPAAWEQGVECVFQFRGSAVRSPAMTRVVLKDGRGAGLQFRGLDPDGRKALGDFVEQLRGEGHV